MRAKLAGDRAMLADRTNRLKNLRTSLVLLLRYAADCSSSLTPPGRALARRPNLRGDALSLRVLRSAACKPSAVRPIPRGFN